MDNIADFFDGINDAVVFSCLQGHMGNAYVKSWDDPKAAMIINGDYGYFGGDAFSEDAANLISKKMALKLGYEYEGEYTTIGMRR